MEGNTQSVGKVGSDVDQSFVLVQQRDASYDPLHSFGNVGAGHQHIVTDPCEYEKRAFGFTPESLKPPTETHIASRLLLPLLALALGLLVVASICSTAKKHSAKLNAGVRRLASEGNEEGADADWDVFADICLELGEWVPQPPSSAGERLSPLMTENFFMDLEEGTSSPPAVPPDTIPAKRPLIEDSDDDDDEEPGPSWKVLKPCSDPPQNPNSTGLLEVPEPSTYIEISAESPASEFSEDDWIQPLSPQQPSGPKGLHTPAPESQAPPKTVRVHLMKRSQMKTSAVSSATTLTLPQEPVIWHPPTAQAAGGADLSQVAQSVTAGGPVITQHPGSSAQPLGVTNTPQLLRLALGNPPLASAAAPSDVPSSSDTKKQSSTRKRSKASGSSAVIKHLLVSKKARIAAIQSSAGGAKARNASEHPYARTPIVKRKVVIKPSCMHSPELPSKSQRYLCPLLAQYRYICRKRYLGQKDVELLLGIAGWLAKYAQERMMFPVEDKPSAAVETLGRRFLLLHTLHSIKTILGNRVDWQAWWQAFVREIPSEYSRPVPFKHLHLSRVLHTFAVQLSNALMKYKLGHAPSDEEVVGIKKQLFIGPTCTESFRKHDWDPWREDGQDDGQSSP